MLKGPFFIVLIVALLTLSCHSGDIRVFSKSSASNDEIDKEIDKFPETFANLKFATTRDWVALDERGAVWLSDDSGKKWRKTVGFAKETQRDDLVFVDKFLGYLLIDELLRKSTDGGKTWIDLSACRVKKDGETTNGIHFIDEKRGWCVGSTYSSTSGLRGIICRTTDGGLTWKESNIIDDEMITRSKGNRWDIRSLWFVDGKVGWAVGYGVVLKTVDQGETWNWVRNIEGVFERIAFSSPKHGWIEEKELSSSLFTNDGGLTWKSVKLPVENDLGTSLLVNRSGQIILLSPTGKIFLSDFSGKSWKRVSISDREWNLDHDNQVWQGDTYLDRSLDGAIVAALLDGASVLSVSSVDEGETWMAKNP